ncbi:MAG: restriction endonuclease [Isosphaeraceae bacterium]
MECLGPQCASLVLEWLKAHAAAQPDDRPAGPGKLTQGSLFTAAPYQEDAPWILSAPEMAGAIEHLQYAVFRRFHNQLTRAERTRLDNTIENALFKIDRYLKRALAAEVELFDPQVDELRTAVRDGREQVERKYLQARRAEAKLAQLSALDAPAFEEFVAELFEASGYDVEIVGGSGDEGADLLLRRRDGLVAVVQCKFHKGVVGSPLLQKFLGTIHHTRSHKGFFVTTSTFSLAAEKFAAENPIELIDGARLVEFVRQALGPQSRRDAEPVWF